MASYDITVRGAGVMGLSVAYVCARRGARVQVVDPNGPASGASGGIVGALAPHTPENWNPKKAFQFDSLMMSGDFWQGVEATSGLPTGYARTGRIQPIADDHALGLAQARAETSKTLWQGRATWTIEDAGDWAPLSPSGEIIHDTLSARLMPRQATLSLAAAVTALGGSVVPDAPDSGAVLWATGVTDLDEMTAQHTRLVGAGIKGQAALIAYDARDLPQLFGDTVHIIPHHDGTTAIGSTTERDFKNTDLDALLDDVLTRAYGVAPMLRDAPVIERWAGVRPRARSRAPMIGHHPFRTGHFIANGGFKIGFGMAPKLAEVMADLILEGRDAIPDGFEATASL
ncbi:MAG: FAD-dependent oxidoreductase [Paracoccaceae bacterium]|nr:FAD-dependent oxidoreductase [Paracoccaceae bacterium]